MVFCWLAGGGNKIGISFDNYIDHVLIKGLDATRLLRIVQNYELDEKSECQYYDRCGEPLCINNNQQMRLWITSHEHTH